MGQGRSEGHATADRFVYLACLWYPAFPPPSTPSNDSCLQPDLEVTMQRWIKATFHQRVNTTHPTHHSGQLKTHGASVGLLPSSHKNNNWLICACIAKLGLDTVEGIFTKTNMAETNIKYQIQVMENREQKTWHITVQLLYYIYYLSVLL